MKIELNNLQISYLKKGEGTNKILLLHGWGSQKETLTGMINHLSNFMEVYAIDLPGFGQSEEPKTVFNDDDYVNIVIEFIKKMNIKKLSLLGHSFGGRTIINLCNANDKSFEIDKLILLDSSGIRHYKKPSLKQKFYKVIFPIIKKISPKLLNTIKTKVGSDDYRNATPMMRDILVKAINTDIKDKIENITYPTLIIWGENDLATPYDDAKYINSKIKDSGIVTITNGGHFPFIDDPFLVNKALESFLNK